MAQQSVLLAWSGGKDSLWTLRQIRRTTSYGVKALLTTIVETDSRVGMHGIRQGLIEAQAKSLGIPLQPILQTAFPDNEAYEATFSEAITSYRKEGISTIAYGDLFLEDIRAYRDGLMQRLDMSAIYPIWQKDTRALAEEIVRSGYDIRVVCVDTEQLDGAFIGRRYDAEFLSDLPAHVDPCGENGEFHTFVSDGELFQTPVRYSVAGRFMRQHRFLYLDLIESKQ